MINLKILFKNTTKYTKDTYSEFVKFHNKKYNFTYNLYTIICSALFLFCIVFQVNKHLYNLAILFCLAITCFILWRFFKPISDVSKELNGDTLKNEKEFSFKFYNDYFIISDNKTYSKMKYFELYKVYETTNFFYLYTDRTHSFLINKRNFSIGTPVDFSEFIHKKLRFRFKSCQ